MLHSFQLWKISNFVIVNVSSVRWSTTQKPTTKAISHLYIEPREKCPNTQSSSLKQLFSIHLSTTAKNKPRGDVFLAINMTSDAVETRESSLAFTSPHTLWRHAAHIFIAILFKFTAKWANRKSVHIRKAIIQLNLKCLSARNCEEEEINNNNNGLVSQSLSRLSASVHLSLRGGLYIRLIWGIRYSECVYHTKVMGCGEKNF